MDSQSFDQVKSDIHRLLLTQLDLERLSVARQRPCQAGGHQPDPGDHSEGEAPSECRRKGEAAERTLLDEVFGLGPLEPLLKDPTISDILVNRRDQVYVERPGCWRRPDVKFRDDRHLLQIIDRIVSGVGRRVDESSPMVDARLADGSRVNAIIPPLALDGPALSIRRFGHGPLTAGNAAGVARAFRPKCWKCSRRQCGPASTS